MEDTVTAQWVKNFALLWTVNTRSWMPITEERVFEIRSGIGLIVIRAKYSTKGTFNKIWRVGTQHDDLRGRYEDHAINFAHA
jgi:hypothetical protein